MAEEYGLTKKGPNIKRLDVILDEMHDDLSESVGINTRQNPESLLNHILTNIADELAQLWELGLNCYYNSYPTTAEGISLDNACSLSGVMRENAEPSYYHILCTGIDGTTLPKGTLIATSDSPSTQLTLEEETQITRKNFNQCTIRYSLPSLDGNPMTIILNGATYSHTPGSNESIHYAMATLADKITDDDFDVSLYQDEDSGETFIKVNSKSDDSDNVLVLSENLSTGTVGTIVIFKTVDDGDILLPNGLITKIVKSVAGLESVCNVGTYIAGQSIETDEEFRKSYNDKIFLRSSRMTESIKALILDNVLGVLSCSVYENYYNITDSMGRPPHSVEAVVDGGDSTEIAEQIFAAKAGGINTYGNETVELPGELGETLHVRFTRPEYVNVWFRVELTVGDSRKFPSNYAELISDIILSEMSGMACGDDVIPQRSMLSTIYAQIPGITYADISMGVGSTKPSEYAMKSIVIDERQRAMCSDGRVDVVISGS